MKQCPPDNTPGLIDLSRPSETADSTECGMTVLKHSEHRVLHHRYILVILEDVQLQGVS